MTTTKQRDAALDAIKTAKTLTATDAARMVCDVANRLDYADGTDDWSGLECLAAAIETQSRATAFASVSFRRDSISIRFITSGSQKMSY